MPPSRIACLLVPQLAVQVALRQRPDLAGRPVVVGGYPHERRNVLGASPEALADGVSPGMPLRQAAGLSPDAVFLPLDASLTGEAFSSLLDVMATFSPAIEPEPPGAAYLDISGLSLALLGLGDEPGEEPLLRALRARILDATGLRARLGAGTGKFVARVAAQLSPPAAPRSVPAGGEQAALAAVPVAVLPCAEETQRRLGRLGLRTLGELAALPFGPVQAQFGAEGARIWRLARGEDPDPLVPVERPAVPTERLEFPTPTADAGALVYAAGQLLRQLLRRPEVGNRLARRLTVRITLEEGSVWERTITFRDATADPATALFAVRTRLESLQLPAAAVAVTCTLHDLCGERGLQTGLFSARSRRLAQLDEAIRHLRARLGAPSVLRVVELEPWSRIPERRAGLVEYLP
jgi:nucleotidyltransferase/DNA polymerase involved in DNA repair